MVQIIDVHCTKCGRRFRTVPAVFEHAGTVHCPGCGTRMTISEPQPVSILSGIGKANAA